MRNMPLAVVFNNFLRTIGGGERSSLDFAAAFIDLGYDVALVTDHKVDMTMEQVSAPFGIDLKDRCSLIEFNGIGALQHFIQTEGCEVFLNHTHCSFIRNYAPIGLYLSMFAGKIGPAEIANLETYSRILCISDFTKQYAEARWSDRLSYRTVHPPISRSHTPDPAVSFAHKEKLILNIGRFNVFGHNKNQLEAIRSFTEAVQLGVFDKEWKLRVIGQVNENPETLAYLDACREAARGCNVEICLNAPLSLLKESYRKASFLFQFTGLGLGFGVQPENCEHLGLVALDGFAYGAIPVVYQRGGAALLVRNGVDGFVFEDLRDFSSICKLMSVGFGTEWHETVFRRGIKRASDFSFSGFRNEVGEEIDRVKLRKESCMTYSLPAENDFKDQLLAQQAQKLSGLLAAAEKLGTQLVDKESELAETQARLITNEEKAVSHAAAQAAAYAAALNDLHEQFVEANHWKQMCLARLGPTRELADHQIDVFRSYTEAMGSPGHRTVTFIGKKFGRSFIVRGLRKLFYLGMAVLKS